MRDNVMWTIGWTIGAVVLIVSIAVGSIWITHLIVDRHTASWQTCIEHGRQMVNGVCL